MATELHVLFLCTGNSARSQMAEAVLNQRGRGRFVAESAGSLPAAQVNPIALGVLREAGIRWQGHPPRGLDGLDPEAWDIVITVCDQAREACPLFSGRAVMAHWGMPDPAAVQGDSQEVQRAFREAFRLISQRVDVLLAETLDGLDRKALQNRLRRIGQTG
jgi:arsenate reductase